jgi:hypothetical protein
MMTDIAHLALEMQQGRFPEWSPRLIIRIGDAIRETLDQHELLLAGELPQLIDDEMRLRDILIAFGALAKDDRTTGPLDLVEILLPPQES